MNSVNNTRKLYIYDRNLELQAQSEAFSGCNNDNNNNDSNNKYNLGMHSHVNWKPSGNLITVSNRRMIGNIIKHEIWFFEKNGLRHGKDY